MGGNRPHRLRIGGSWRTTDRDAWSQGVRIQPFFWAPDDPRWQQPPEDFFDGRYASEGDENLLLSRELAGGSYTAEDELLAGFVMAEVQAADRLRLVGGVRYESYGLEVSSENQLGPPEFTERNSGELLPALSSVLTFGGNHQVRISASRTLARPKYRELAPITYREVLGGEQVIGTADLERTRIDNLDLRWEAVIVPGESARSREKTSFPRRTASRSLSTSV